MCQLTISKSIQKWGNLITIVITKIKIIDNVNHIFWSRDFNIFPPAPGPQLSCAFAAVVATCLEDRLWHLPLWLRCLGACPEGKEDEGGVFWTAEKPR